MVEDTPIGNLVARLQITGSPSEISTQLVYNSSEVKTNGTNYFTLNFTNLYVQYRKFYSIELQRKQFFERRRNFPFVFLSSSSRL